MDALGLYGLISALCTISISTTVFAGCKPLKPVFFFAFFLAYFPAFLASAAAASPMMSLKSSSCFTNRESRLSGSGSGCLPLGLYICPEPFSSCLIGDASDWAPPMAAPSHCLECRSWILSLYLSIYALMRSFSSSFARRRSDADFSNSETLVSWWRLALSFSSAAAAGCFAVDFCGDLLTWGLGYFSAMSGIPASTCSISYYAGCLGSGDSAFNALDYMASLLLGMFEITFAL